MANILLVDDEAALRRTLRTILERAGHMVHEAEDGDDALKMFAAEPPDLVIMDIIMPNREGVGTIGELRGRAPKLPIIAISGGGSIGGDLVLTLASQFGATETLAKPIRETDLLEAVDRCLADPAAT
jgi:DNA-binding NtrC family response regulator